MLTYRDPLAGIIVGFRTALVFSIGAFIWINTAFFCCIINYDFTGHIFDNVGENTVELFYRW
ncbi:hypothetical protein P4S63_03695 [Pseudoalteromonas sp. B193]